MANSSLLWHWSSQIDSSKVPSWVVPEMLNGRYQSPMGNPVAFLASNITAKRSGRCTNGFLAALDAAIAIQNGRTEDGYGMNKKWAVAEFVLCGPREYGGTGERVSVAYSIGGSTAGKFFASKSGVSYNVAKGTSAPFFLALWNLFMEHAKFKSKFLEICAANDDDTRRDIACFLADFAYAVTGSAQANISICAPSEVSELTQGRIQSAGMKITYHVGGFTLFQTASGSSKNKSTNGKNRSMTTASFVGSFKLNDRVLSEQEEKLVPQLDEKYIVGDTLVNLCKHIKESTKRSRPIRNILLRGEPGTGKTEMYSGIAAGCHLPLYTFACHAMTEPFDLFGQFVPVDDEGNQTGQKLPLDKVLDGLPSVTDMSMDPVYAYQEITGMYKADATATECMAAAFNLAQKSIDVQGGQQRFKFVPGQLIYAMKNGGVLGIDEVTLPQNPGVIPALNPAMDGTQSLTLPTGEIVHRHPDCIFVGTTNIDLEGCRALNQAWVDRCQLIIDVKEVGDEELITRVKAMVDYDENNDEFIDFNKFVDVYKGLKEIARKRHLDDGQIGPRKLADWISSTLITNDPVESAKMTIIPGATADFRGMQELLQKVEDFF